MGVGSCFNFDHLEFQLLEIDLSGSIYIYKRKAHISIYMHMYIHTYKHTCVTFIHLYGRVHLAVAEMKIPRWPFKGLLVSNRTHGQKSSSSCLPHYICLSFRELLCLRLHPSRSSLCPVPKRDRSAKRWTVWPEHDALMGNTCFRAPCQFGFFLCPFLLLNSSFLAVFGP